MKNVIVAEDYEDMRTLMMDVVAHPEIRLYEADGGKTAIRLAHEIPTDLILLDIMMPDLTGWQVMDALRGEERTRDAIIVFCSGSIEHRARYEESPPANSCFISKPFEVNHLVHTVHSRLGLDEGDSPWTSGKLFRRTT